MAETMDQVKDLFEDYPIIAWGMVVVIIAAWIYLSYIR